MATQKRRVVYLSDRAWDAAKWQAEQYGLSSSALIESLIVGGRVIPVSMRESLGLPPLERPSNAKTKQAERDRILRRVNRGG